MLLAVHLQVGMAIRRDDRFERGLPAGWMRDFEAIQPYLEFSGAPADREAIGSLLIELTLLTRRRSIEDAYGGMNLLKSWLDMKGGDPAGKRGVPSITHLARLHSLTAMNGHLRYGAG